MQNLQAILYTGNGKFLEYNIAINIIRLFITRSNDNGKINFYNDLPVFLERSTSRLVGDPCSWVR